MRLISNSFFSEAIILILATAKAVNIDWQHTFCPSFHIHSNIQNREHFEDSILKKINSEKNVANKIHHLICCRIHLY